MGGAWWRYKNPDSPVLKMRVIQLTNNYVFQNFRHQELRSGRGIEVESPKCERIGVDGLATESPVAIALRFGHAPP